MKKIILCILTLSLLAYSGFAAPKAKGDVKANVKEESRAEIKERLASNVIIKENGDVITKLPSFKNLKQVSSPYAPQVLVLLMTYVYPEADFEKFDKDMSGLKTPTIDKVTETASNFLRSKYMFLRKIAYSSGSVKLLIDDGLPLYAYLKNDEKTFNAIANRSKERPSSKDANMKKWVSDSKDKVQKKFTAKKEAFAAIVMGFNKETNEYMLLSGKNGIIWVFESELKASLISLYQLKY